MEYLKAWTEPLNELTIYEWAALFNAPCWADLQKTMQKLNSIGVFETTENDFESRLHNQCGYLIDYCTAEKLSEWKEKNVSITNRWMDVFKHLHANNNDYNELSVIAEYILCLPGTNCSVERLFASVTTTWTSSKTNLLIETLRAILMVKCNFKQTCIEFYRYLLKNPYLLKQIASKDKYKVANTDNDLVMLTDSSDGEDSE